MKVIIRNTGIAKNKNIELKCLVCGNDEFYEIIEEYTDFDKEVYCVSCGWYAKFRNNYDIELKDNQVKVEYEE